MKKQLVLAAAALALAACTGDEHLDDTNAPVELRLTSALEVQTRTSHGLDTQLKENETVHVWVDDAETDEAQYQNNVLTAGSDGALTGGETMYFPSTGNAVDIYAIHGDFTTDLTDFWGAEQTHTVAQDQRTGQATDGYAQSDLVYARRTDVARTKETVALTFTHLLSKLEVVLVQGAGSPTISKVEILNTQLEANFTPAKANGTITVTASGTAGENPIEIDCGITDAEAAAQTDSDEGKVFNEAIIVPQTLATGTEFIRITTTEGGELIYSLPDAKTFTPAKKYRYTITANLTGLDVKADISDWEDGENVSGDATMPSLLGDKTVEGAAVGDYYMADGSVLSKDALTDELKEKIAAVVFAVGQSEYDNSDYTSTGIGQAQCHGYAVALNDATSDYCMWGEYGISLGLDNYNDYYYENDWNGYSYTQTIIEHVGGKENLNASEEPGYPATYYAVVAYEADCPAPEGSSGWFLPASGQMWKAYLLQSDLFTSVGVGIDDIGYWSSSEYYKEPENYALHVSAFYGTVSSQWDKRNSTECVVRPVLAF